VCRLYVIQQDKLKKQPLAASPRRRVEGSTE
jgi:hypothetical protein